VSSTATHPRDPCESLTTPRDELVLGHATQSNRDVAERRSPSNPPSFAAAPVLHEYCTNLNRSTRTASGG
jgi:hypothetical protein